MSGGGRLDSEVDAERGFLTPELNGVDSLDAVDS